MSVLSALVVCLGGVITLRRLDSSSAVCSSMNCSYFILMTATLLVLLSMLTLR